MDCKGFCCSDSTGYDFDNNWSAGAGFKHTDSEITSDERAVRLQTDDINYPIQGVCSVVFLRCP